MAIRPVHRLKHIVDSGVTVTKATTLVQTLVKGVDAPVLANTNQVETGSKVNGIYLNVQVAANETNLGVVPNAYMLVRKNPNGILGTSNPDSTGDTDVKKFIIHQEMIMIQNVQGGNPRTLFTGVIVIPKGMRRFAVNDELELIFRCTGINTVLCFQCIYKEFR